MNDPTQAFIEERKQRIHDMLVNFRNYTSKKHCLRNIEFHIAGQKHLATILFGYNIQK